MKYTVREASLDDAAEIAVVVRASYGEYVDAIEPPSTAVTETVESIASKLESARALVAEANGSIVGTVFFQPCEKHLYLFRLAVLPGCRAQGLGSHLVQLVEEQARLSGFCKVQLFSRLALQGNIAFYERLGYTHVGEGGADRYPVPFFAILEKELC